MRNKSNFWKTFFLPNRTFIVPKCFFLCVNVNIFKKCSCHKKMKRDFESSTTTPHYQYSMENSCALPVPSYSSACINDSACGWMNTISTRCRRGTGEGFTKECLAQGVRQQHVWRCNSVILKSVSVSDKAFYKEPPVSGEQGQSKLRVSDQSLPKLERKGGWRKRVKGIRKGRRKEEVDFLSANEWAIEQNDTRKSRMNRGYWI